MSSNEIKKLVASGALSSEDAVRKLLDSGEHIQNQNAVCPECESVFYCSFQDPNDSEKLGRMNTCSDACQVIFNTTVFELDAGRTIHRIQDLTPERTSELLCNSGLIVTNIAKKVLLS